MGKVKEFVQVFEGNEYSLVADIPTSTDLVAGKSALSDAVDGTLDASSGGTSATPLAVKTVNDKVTALSERVTTLEEASGLGEGLPEASTTTKGIVQLSSDLNSDSETLASTPKAIKTVNDNVTELKNNLNTAKTDLTNSIENVNNKIGELTSLTTINKDTVVTAINEVNSKFATSSGGFEIGDIGITVFPIDENQKKRRYLNGQTILIDQYQSFTEKLKTAIQQYPSLSCSESEWQEIVSNSDVGQCGKFVLDESAGTIRLPKIVMPIQGLIDLASLGEIVNSGLPNITAQLNFVICADHRTTASTGAFKSENTGDTGTAITGNYDWSKITFNASDSNSIYGNSETVQQEQIQYPYFIQVATGVEETVPAEKELTLNNPYSLLEHKIVDCKLNNLSWLRSEGQFNSGDTYSDAYNLLLSEKTTPTRDFSIKTSDEEYTDYDFVLNTTDKTFRLPLFTSERQLVEKKEPTDDDPTWYNLYSDGWLEQGGSFLNNTQENTPVVFNLLKAFRDTKYVVSKNSGIPQKSNALWCHLSIYNRTKTSFQTTISSFSNDECWFACGYSDEKPSSASNLYYYIGDTVQNANLINAGRIEEKIVDLIPNNSNLIANYAMPSEKYIDLDIPNTTSLYKYVVPDDGYICCHYITNNSAFSIAINPTNTTTIDNMLSTSKICGVANSTSVEGKAFIVPVCKNDQAFFGFNTTIGTLYHCRFIYAKGAI